MQANIRTKLAADAHLSTIIIIRTTTSIPQKFMTASLILKKYSTIDTIKHTTKEGKICF